MKKATYFAYGLVCHAMFLAVFLYMAGFLGNVLVPKTVDSGTEVPLGVALWINSGLLILFGLSHSIMARPTFKRWWTQFVPTVLERSTYVLVSNLVVILLLWQWRPMGGVIWDVEAPAIRTALMAVFGLGWLLIVASSLLINHFDLFGTRQVWLYLRGKEYTPPKFGMPVLYKWVRHPLYVGWLMAFWVTPTMSVGHLVFTLGMSAYILIAIQLEERNLVEDHAEYAAYRGRTPMLIPFTKRGNSGSRVAAGGAQVRAH